MIVVSSCRQKADRKGRVASALPSFLLILAAGALFTAPAFPLWSITLDAPQYPEGLGMRIWAHTVDGVNPHDLANINQLNHYIGMKPILPEAIPELRIIRPLAMVFGALCLLAALWPKWPMLAALLVALSAAGTAGLVDFWLWEYDYGHNLDPTAAIKVPGMSYQPPLIGTAQLLNFHSSAWPALGGYLMFAAGVLIALALLLSWRKAHPARLPRAVLVAAAMGFLACGSQGPAPIHWGEEACHHCKMTLVQKGFAAQRINAKGKAFHFDAIECLLAEMRADPPGAGERFYVSDWSRPEAAPLPAQEAVYLQGGRISSPMGGAWAAFAAQDSALAFQSRLGGDLLSWEEAQGR